MNAQNNNLIADYERHIAELEKIVTAMENGELSLDEALKQYEHGITLVRHCQQALDAAEQKIHILTENVHGEESLTPYIEAEDNNH